MDRKTRNELVLAYIPLIKSVLASYTKDPQLYDDLFQHVCVTLLTSKKCFPSQRSITWAIKKYFRDYHPMVKTRKVKLSFSEVEQRHLGSYSVSYLPIEMELALSKLKDSEREILHSYFYLDTPIRNRSLYMKKTRALANLKPHLCS